MTAQINKKFCFKISLVYYASILFANLMIMFIPMATVTFPTVNEESMIKWISFTDENQWLINIITVLCFVIPSAICLKECFSIFFAKNDDEIAKKIVNLPLRFSFLGAFGWILTFFAELIVLIYAKHVLSIKVFYIIVNSLLFLALEGIFSFIVSYLVLATVNRATVLPKLFPNGEVTKIPGVKNLSLTLMFVVLYVSICFFPIIFLLTAYISDHLNYGTKISFDTIIMSFVLLFSGLALTVVFMKLFTIPLKKLTIQTKEIKKGNYDYRVNISSNDEMGVLSDAFNDMTESIKEKEFMRSTFGKIVDPNVRDYLLKGNVALGGETRNVTIMFCDIRNFTAMSESMSPEKVVSLLNKYFTEMEKCISKNHGIINKYIGDAVMGIFGAPVKSENHALNAFNAAMEMRAALVALNKKLEGSDFPQIAFGIGLHSGDVLAGNIGAENRIEYTVIGDTVNTASRIESLCKSYQKDLLMSESTCKLILDAAAGEFAARQDDFVFVDEADIRGKTEKVKLFTKDFNLLKV